MMICLPPLMREEAAGAERRRYCAAIRVAKRPDARRLYVSAHEMSAPGLHPAVDAAPRASGAVTIRAGFGSQRASRSREAIAAV